MRSLVRSPSCVLRKHGMQRGPRCRASWTTTCSPGTDSGRRSRTALWRSCLRWRKKPTQRAGKARFLRGRPWIPEWTASHSVVPNLRDGLYKVEGSESAKIRTLSIFGRDFRRLLGRQVHEIVGALLNDGVVIFVEGTEERAPDGHVCGTVRGRAASEPQCGSNLMRGKFTFVRFGELRKVGGRSFHGRGRRAMALSFGAMTGSAIRREHFFSGRDAGLFDGGLFYFGLARRGCCARQSPAATSRTPAAQSVFLNRSSSR